MRELDPVLSLEGEHAIGMFCDAEDRNDQAQRELKHYEATKKFLFIHEITDRYRTSLQLEQQVTRDPDAFSQAIFNAINNLNRYRSKVNQKHYRDEIERLTWLKKIHEYEQLVDLMQKIIQGQTLDQIT